jgi:hypothetical protein
MEKIIIHFDKTVSLGYNCFIKKFLDSKISQETNFFDWIGTSMWSINLLIEDDFKDIFQLRDLIYIQTVTSGNIQHAVTHKKYYLRFPHDLQKDDVENIGAYFRRPMWQTRTRLQNILKIKDSYVRRATRFNQFLKTQQKILFIRFEEKLQDRIIHKTYEKYFLHTELEHVIFFSKLIKRKYQQLQFEIIFISGTNENNYDSDNNILILKDTIGITWDKCADELRVLFDDNMDFILASICKQ